VLGVKYLIVGSITKFGTEQKKQGVGGGGFGYGGFGIGKVGREKGKANVAITTRMIDVSTAEIMASGKGEGVSSRSGLLLGGGGASWGGAGFGEIDMSSSDYRETILGEATELAVRTSRRSWLPPGVGWKSSAGSRPRGLAATGLRQFLSSASAATAS
jgi:curli biogenesis system outer membrane secretion channel CsgG